MTKKQKIEFEQNKEMLCKYIKAMSNENDLLIFLNGYWVGQTLKLEERGGKKQ